jgi:hypothetical protein
MADYQIICTRKSPSTPSGHHHIVQVGLGSGSSYTQLLTVADVYGLMRNGTASTPLVRARVAPRSSTRGAAAASTRCAPARMPSRTTTSTTSVTAADG